MAAMPLFMVERQFAEAFASSPERAKLVQGYEAEREIRWLTSFLSADKKKTYCLYEAVDLDMIRQHAKDLGLPADAIVEVSELDRH
jgi:hypothetical protein